MAAFKGQQDNLEVCSRRGFLAAGTARTAGTAGNACRLCRVCGAAPGHLRRSAVLWVGGQGVRDGRLTSQSRHFDQPLWKGRVLWTHLDC
jgi:hypothetical protein